MVISKKYKKKAYLKNLTKKHTVPSGSGICKKFIPDTDLGGKKYRIRNTGRCQGFGSALTLCETGSSLFNGWGTGSSFKMKRNCI
jgi:hypothetical protein